jgi:hypothetical protein
MKQLSGAARGGMGSGLTERDASLALRRLCALVALALLPAAGCGESKPAGSGDDTESACTPGEIRSCEGPGGCEGSQEWLSDDRGFSECDCELPLPSAGASGTASGGGDIVDHFAARRSSDQISREVSGRVARA